MVLSWATARMALPMRVNLMNTVSRVVATAVATKMTSSEERMMVTFSMKGNSSMSAGNDRKSEVWARST